VMFVEVSKGNGFNDWAVRRTA